jgi:hypothetical protein
MALPITKQKYLCVKVGNDLFVGGSQGYGKGEIAGNLDIDSSQLYFKFQYLFEIRRTKMEKK